MTVTRGKVPIRIGNGLKMVINISLTLWFNVKINQTITNRRSFKFWKPHQLPSTSQLIYKNMQF